MKITKEWLVEKRACKEGIAWLEKEGSMDVYELISQLKDVNCSWASWLITKVLEKIDNVKYAVFAAEQVIEIYEKQSPRDDRPRKAIEAAKAYIDNPANKNADAADVAVGAYTAAKAAADAARAAAKAAARAAAYAAYTAARNAADAAARAAYTAAYAAAYAAVDAAYTAARNAADAAYTTYTAYEAYAAAKAAARAAAKKEIQLKIIAYGERLLRANPKLKQEAKK